jgi:SagB-type dehydrogenase family enzyme
MVSDPDGVGCLRRAHSLVGFWNESEFVVENYLAGSRVALTPALLQLLDENPGPLQREDLRAGLALVDPGGELLEALVRHHLYLQLGSDLELRDQLLADSWAWGAVARWFHYATRDTPFEPDLDTQRQWLTDLAASTPPPPPVQERDGARTDLDAPLPLDSSTLGQALTERRSTRRWPPEPIARSAFSTLLSWTWGTQHYVTDSPIGPYQLKTSPSGGARHSIEVYPVAIRVEGIDPGVYHYSPDHHRLTQLRRGSADDLATEAVTWFANQPWLSDAAAVFVMTSVLARSMWKYRHPHAYRVVLLDAGHLGQTFHLVCTALGLGPFTSSGLRESTIEEALGLDGITEVPIYAAATGRFQR